MMNGNLIRTQWVSSHQEAKSSSLQGIPPQELEQVIKYALENPQELYPGQGPPLELQQDLPES